eukprot:gene32544-40156_t
MGKPVITSVPDMNELARMDSNNAANKELMDRRRMSVEFVRNEKADKLFKKVTAKVDEFYGAIRSGKSCAVSERLVKHLVGSQEQVIHNAHFKKSHGRRAATGMLMPSNDVGAVLAKNEYLQALSQALNGDEQVEDDQSEDADKDVEYLAGTSIYFGATISIQARHGGFLSYNSNSLKASAHKIMHNTRFVVKNSEDLTDIGIMKYGDALWLQAGHFEVLGAQYGSLVDQKREIQPALISCKRQSMFKAQQYGRWIVLNRGDPMGTMGQPVLHLDQIILEQEWYFLASYSPSESNMYKWPSKTDDLYESSSSGKHATKTRAITNDLFRPTEECNWKVHLVALPTQEKDDERQRQLLLQK